jgi:hypothetical protein
LAIAMSNSHFVTRGYVRRCTVLLLQFISATASFMIGLVILTDASAWLIDEALTFEDIAVAGILALFLAFFYLRLRPSWTGSHR